MRLKQEALAGRTVPASIVMKALEAYWGGAKMPKVSPEKKHQVERKEQKISEFEADIAPGALLRHIEEDVLGEGITQDALVRAVEPHTGKTYSESPGGGGKGANWRGWKETLSNGKLPRNTAAILAALKDLGHEFPR
jgi:hypothetical protein